MSLQFKNQSIGERKELLHSSFLQAGEERKEVNLVPLFTLKEEIGEIRKR